MKHPEFNKMFEQLSIVRMSAVFVNDLSRLEGKYIELGRLIKEFFLNIVFD